MKSKTKTKTKTKAPARSPKAPASRAEQANVEAGKHGVRPPQPIAERQALAARARVSDEEE